MENQDFNDKKISSFFKSKWNSFISSLSSLGSLENSYGSNYWETGHIRFFKKLKIKRINISAVSTFIVFLIIYLSLCVVFKPWDIFSTTTTAGGDTGTHHYGAKFLLDNLLPQFRVTGWSNGWFAGMPIIHFYFTFPYLLIALLAKIVTYNIAFKIVTVLGSFILPACVYWMMRWFRFKYPYPLLAAMGSTLFLFMESFSIYGGNFLSTLAGEFGYSLSFALCFLFLGTMHLAFEKGAKINWLFVLNCFILMALALSHVLTTVCLLAMIPWLLLENSSKRNLFYTISVLVLAFFLTAFWSVPFALKLKYTPNMGWDNLKGFKALAPFEIMAVVVLAVIGIIFYIMIISRRDDKRLIVFSISYLLLNFAFFIPSGGRIWNARLLPFIYINAFFLACYMIYLLFGFLMSWLSGKKAIARKVTVLLFMPLLAFTLFASVIATKPKAAGWAAYNYTGYETKPHWDTYMKMMDYIKSKPEGRWMIEQDHDNLNKLGTTRAFELIPFWTDSSTMEGLLVEGAFTSPFHFSNQALLSKKPSNAIPGLDQPSRNVKIGVNNLKMMNIRYMIASSDEVKKELDENPDADFLTSFDVFNFYEINTSGKYIEILKYEPLRIKTSEWYDSILPWFNYDDSDRAFIIWDQGEEEIGQFEEITAEQVNSLEKHVLNYQGEVIKEKIENEKITFETTAIGVPHLIKISYFPNWEAIGAEGPFAISPSFMMVIPTQNKVTLYYGSTNIDIISRTITQTTWAFLLVVLITERIIYLRNKRKNKK
ncbi:MAG: 6-pyruvoyl-tetrahydropterin synthase-related protein [Actinomycetota bacterium]|nr:6-pyruvoyl-tetrahydropterin synthase-related protein [Actinomycetota bacterium]